MFLIRMVPSIYFGGSDLRVIGTSPGASQRESSGGVDSLLAEGDGDWIHVGGGHPALDMRRQPGPDAPPHAETRQAPGAPPPSSDAPQSSDRYHPPETSIYVRSTNWLIHLFSQH